MLVHSNLRWHSRMIQGKLCDRAQKSRHVRAITMVQGGVAERVETMPAMPKIELIAVIATQTA
jgi:hypothetical protein